MKKALANVSLQVSFLKEGKRYVAYSPALDLSTSGKTFDEARNRFEEASVLFLEELHKAGTTENVLKSLGWQKKQPRSWTPPIIVSQETQTLHVPVA